MEERNLLQRILVDLEDFITKELLLIDKCFIVLQTTRREERLYFRTSIRSVTEEQKVLRTFDRLHRHDREDVVDWMERCFQISTGKCAFCERYSDYQEEIVSIYQEIDTLIGSLYHKLYYAFPHLFTRVPNLREWEDNNNAKYALHLELYQRMRRVGFRCSCIPSRRQKLDRIKSNVWNLVRQRID